MAGLDGRGQAALLPAALPTAARPRTAPGGNVVPVRVLAALSIVVNGWPTVPVGGGCGAPARYVRRRRLGRRPGYVAV